MTTHRLFVFGILAGIELIAPPGSALCQVTSARDVLLRFCDFDAQGGQLTHEGWQKVSALFFRPGAPKRDKITVVRDFVVSGPAPEGGKVEFYVEYVQLGRIDPSKARFSTLPPMKVRAGFDVIKPSGPELGGGSNQVESSEWRIAGAVPEPHVTVDTAIHYVMELRANAHDATIKKNADKTLAALKRFR